MPKLRVVFQGGGARLVTLIAAADALRELEITRGLEIEHVAGVSAGAIAAAMFASHRSMREQIEVLKRAGPEMLRALGKMPQGPALLWALITGEPLLREAAVNTLVRELFYKTDPPMARLADLRVPVSIIASDIATRQRIDYPPTATQDLARIICDSCALPLAFRTHKDKAFIVDGGLCSNLPVDVVLGGAVGRSCVIAFRFDDRAKPPPPVASLGDYLGALLSTAIEAGVDSAADRVIAAGGHVCLLPDLFETFDFEKALSDGLTDPSYGFARRQARDGLVQILDKHFQTSGPTALTRPARSLPHEIFEAHRTLMRAFPMRVVRSATIAVANCLRPPEDPASAISDDIYQIVDYVAEGEQLAVLRIGAPSGQSAVEDSDPCDVWLGSARLKARQVLVAIEDPKTVARLLRYNLIFLDAPVPSSAGPVRVIYHTRQRNALGNLRTKGGLEWLRAVNTQKAVTEREDQIILFPRTHPLPVTSDLCKRMARIPFEHQPPGFATMSAAWVEGQAMTDVEISEALSEYGLSSAGIGLQALGWRTEKVSPGHYAGVAIEQEQAP